MGIPKALAALYLDKNSIISLFLLSYIWISTAPDSLATKLGDQLEKGKTTVWLVF